MAQQRIIDMAKSRIANFSNLSDNFLIIFSVHLVGLANFVSRKYWANRYWPTNLDFRFKFWTFHEFWIIRHGSENIFENSKFEFTRQKKVGRLDCRDRFYSEPTGHNCINSNTWSAPRRYSFVFSAFWNSVFRQILNCWVQTKTKPTHGTARTTHQQNPFTFSFFFFFFFFGGGGLRSPLPRRAVSYLVLCYQYEPSGSHR